MIPKEIIAQQKMMYLSMSINSKLNKAVKDGIYLSNFFIDQFESEYLNNVLENWELLAVKSEFWKKLNEIVLENLKTIELRIKKGIEYREHIIDEIFRLFNHEYYFGMITLSLSQIDGIMKDITDGNNGFYSSNNKNKKENPNRMKYLEDNFYINFFSEYELLNIENRNEYELFKKDITDMTLLNRHSILHGESKEFGNIINAVKAILLLVFIADLHDINN